MRQLHFIPRTKGGFPSTAFKKTAAPAPPDKTFTTENWKAREQLETAGATDAREKESNVDLSDVKGWMRDQTSFQKGFRSRDSPIFLFTLLCPAFTWVREFELKSQACMKSSLVYACMHVCVGMYMWVQVSTVARHWIV